MTFGPLAKKSAIYLLMSVPKLGLMGASENRECFESDGVPGEFLGVKKETR
jgi:hypothetical protein